MLLKETGDGAVREMVFSYITCYFFYWLLWTGFSCLFGSNLQRCFIFHRKSLNGLISSKTISSSTLSSSCSKTFWTLQWLYLQLTFSKGWVERNGLKSTKKQEKQSKLRRWTVKSLLTGLTSRCLTPTLNSETSRTTYRVNPLTLLMSDSAAAISNPRADQALSPSR